MYFPLPSFERYIIQGVSDYTLYYTPLEYRLELSFEIQFLRVLEQLLRVENPQPN